MKPIGETKSGCYGKEIQNVINWMKQVSGGVRVKEDMFGFLRLNEILIISSKMSHG